MWTDELEKKVKEDGQHSVAKKLNASQSSISLWLKGERIPNTRLILPLASLLNMEPKKLLEEINQNEKG
ncbi:helix-turn-helix domain-containing protein [Vibrio harveyi]